MADKKPEEKVTPQHEGELTEKKETPPEPKEVGKLVITVTVTSFDNGKQDIQVQTPNNTSMAENLGTLDIARAILLKKL